MLLYTTCGPRSLLSAGLSGEFQNAAGDSIACKFTGRRTQRTCMTFSIPVQVGLFGYNAACYGR